MDTRITDVLLLGDQTVECIFIHGYTGGLTDFAELPIELQREKNIRVWYPLLPGHGTTLSDLEGLSIEDIFDGIDAHIRTSIAQGTKVVLIGMSLGAQAALYFASKHAVAAVIALATTHTLRFPLMLPGIEVVSLFKQRWKKRFAADHVSQHSDTQYTEMLTDGFFLSRVLRNRVTQNAASISAPILFIHGTEDTLGDPRGVTELRTLIPSAHITDIRVDTSSHNVLCTDKGGAVALAIHTYIRDHVTESVACTTKERATAVLAAYNEAPRIASVIQALLASQYIDEIIVVDDGSTDGTHSVLNAFPTVRVIRNHVNKGKGGSMDVGVRSAKNDLLFFCDADLVGFTGTHADAIIAPVRDGTFDMFIGMRGNFMQRAIPAWGLNSGERTLRKKTWYALAAEEKHRYRVEVALNTYVRLSTERGYGWKMYDYSQTLKEKKYGVLKGTVLRWWMNFDVLTSYKKALYAGRR